MATEGQTATGERGAGLLRVRREGGQRVTYAELFFDLVYAFAVTQLAHLLLAHLDARGAARTLLLLLAVWWAWIYTAWITNWFDPDRRAVRLMLGGAILASLVMSAAMPEAFGARGLAFAGAYVALQVGRSLFAVAALGGEPGLRRNFQRILAWSAAAGALWLAGGFARDTARDALWLAAVVVDYVAPAVGFFTPGLGRSRTTDWTIAGGHLAERCQAFLIIALGESVLDTSAAFGEMEITAARAAAFVVAFLGSVAFWWVYFDRSADAAGDAIDRSADPGRLGRSAYTYCHLPMVAGIIVAAVADDLTIAHPGGHAGAAQIAATLGGPALFLAGHALFKRAAFGRLSLPRLLALLALAALVPAGLAAPPLALGVAATLVVAAVAVADVRFGRHAIPAGADEVDAERVAERV
ncbi:MAG TPA: low temperature requirement protein A [Thermomicrobiales bacterium]|nr:low temperature requirement protein A [Thermomicrobiales bacterium]